MKLTNASGGTIVMPDGAELTNGEAVDVSDETAAMSGVASLIDDGKLVASKAASKAEKKAD